LRNHYATVTECEKFLIVYASEGTYGSEVYVKNLKNGLDSEFIKLVSGFNYDNTVIENKGDIIYMLTNEDASMYKVVAIDINKPQKSNWKDVVKERKNKLESASYVGGKLICTYLKDASSEVLVFNLSGDLDNQIELPSIGSVYGFTGQKRDSTVFYTFTSFTSPPTTYSYDISSKVSSLYRKSEVQFNTDNYETKQIFYTSKDGTQIPMFIVHKKGLKLDGNNPVFLYGYGGFNVSLLPSFNVARMIFLEQGGIYAMPSLRGGGEYGEAWHKAGMLDKKQNVFDDFIAAAEYLIEKKYTNPSKIAIHGGSNGGLLVGAVMTQRPELFRVAIPSVGVMDMLRFHKFTIGHAWVVEYGSSEKEDQFQNLYAYSPLHNLKEGVEYPATLVTTADHDDRVVPAHSYKFIATLQEKYKGKNPMLIRIDTKAGHGAGKSTEMIIEEWTDKWAFIFKNLDIDYK
jgi:prolyl oligopeptidase